VRQALGTVRTSQKRSICLKSGRCMPKALVLRKSKTLFPSVILETLGNLLRFKFENEIAIL